MKSVVRQNYQQPQRTPTKSVSFSQLPKYVQQQPHLAKNRQYEEYEDDDVYEDPQEEYYEEEVQQPQRSQKQRRAIEEDDYGDDNFEEGELTEKSWNKYMQQLCKNTTIYVGKEKIQPYGNESDSTQSRRVSHR